MLSRAVHKRPDYEGNGQNSGRYCHRRFACENGNQNYCAREKKQYVYGDREEAPCELQRNWLSTLSAFSYKFGDRERDEPTDPHHYAEYDRPS